MKKFLTALSAACLIVLAPAAAGGAKPLYRVKHFHSAPGLRPPVVFKSGSDPDPLASGDIFLEVNNAVVAGPMILDPSGRLIWWDPLPNNGFAYAFAVQRYEGQPVLTFFQGGGKGNPPPVGKDVILNAQYQQIATVRGSHGWLTERHDFVLTPAGTALITVQKDEPADLRSVGGPRHGMVHDNGIQEVQVSTGQVLWQWDALQHVRLSASHAGTPGGEPYDFFHVNSVQELPNGNLLVSARHTFAVYEISKATGRILWQLGGKHSSFRLGRGVHFEWQHDAQLQSGDTMTLFDNGAGLSLGERQSRALRIRLDFKRMRATLVRAYTNKPPLLALDQGSVEPLPDGNLFVDWGYYPYLTEFGRSGRQLFSLHLPYPIQTYRGYRFGWSAQPTAPPALALSRTSTGTRVYASWNGATDVSAWEVLAGPAPNALVPVGQFQKTSFETAMWVQNTQPYFGVQALGPQGAVLGTSVTVTR